MVQVLVQVLVQVYESQVPHMEFIDELVFCPNCLLFGGSSLPFSIHQYSSCMNIQLCILHKLFFCILQTIHNTWHHFYRGSHIDHNIKFWYFWLHQPKHNFPIDWVHIPYNISYIFHKGQLFNNSQSSRNTYFHDSNNVFICIKHRFSHILKTIILLSFLYLYGHIRKLYSYLVEEQLVVVLQVSHMVVPLGDVLGDALVALVLVLGVVVVGHMYLFLLRYTFHCWDYIPDNMKYNLRCLNTNLCIDHQLWHMFSTLSSNICQHIFYKIHLNDRKACSLVHSSFWLFIFDLQHWLQLGRDQRYLRPSCLLMVCFPLVFFLIEWFFINFLQDLYCSEKRSFSTVSNLGKPFIYLHIISLSWCFNMFSINYYCLEYSQAIFVVFFQFISTQFLFSSNIYNKAKIINF